MSNIFYPGTEQLTKTKLIFPLSIETVKRHLRLAPEFDDDDDYLTSIIESAVTMAENFINKDIAYTKNTLRIEDFDDDFIKVYDGNFLSFESAKDQNNSSVGTVYLTTAKFDYFTIEWTTPIKGDPLTIVYYTGFADGTTPEILKQACLIQVANFYDNERSSYNWGGMKNNDAFERILSSYQAKLC